MQKNNAFMHIFSVVSVTAILLVGCTTAKTVTDEMRTTPSEQKMISAIPDTEIFTGCYSIHADQPAQIKINKSSYGWSMQMKEPPNAHYVWDESEPLTLLDRSEMSTFFPISMEHVDIAIRRADDVLVIAHIRDGYVASSDSSIDSEYLSYLYGNTRIIYKVDCDEIQIEL
ncbi:hypothetical protein [Psychrobacter sp. AOP7-B1-24]|uniref:hypothetical protein n=1 Tax=Psychrobacter sp. AOP7-B1-24 TaxID=3457645 RepID=UPI00402BCF30